MYKLLYQHDNREPLLFLSQFFGRENLQKSGGRGGAGGGWQEGRGGGQQSSSVGRGTAEGNGAEEGPLGTCLSGQAVEPGVRGGGAGPQERRLRHAPLLCRHELLGLSGGCHGFRLYGRHNRRRRRRLGALPSGNGRLLRSKILS